MSLYFLLKNRKYLKNVMSDYSNGSDLDLDLEQSFKPIDLSALPKDLDLDNAILAHDLPLIKKLKKYSTNTNLLTSIKDYNLEALKILAPKKVSEEILHKAIDLAEKNDKWDIVDHLLYISDLKSEKYKKIVNARYRKLSNYKDYELDLINDLKTFSETDVSSLLKYYNAHTIEQLGTAIIQDQLPKTVNKKCLNYIHTLPDNIDNMRKKIYDHFKDWKDSVSEMNSKNLRLLFDKYDELWFNNDLNKYMKTNHIKFNFYTTSPKGETFSTEGICYGPEANQCEYKMTIPLEHFKKINGTRLINVAGHLCKDQLECLMRVIEHEMCHLIIFMYCGDIVLADQHSKMFTDMSKRLFNHTDFHHYIF